MELLRDISFSQVSVKTEPSRVEIKFSLRFLFTSGTPQSAVCMIANDYHSFVIHESMITTLSVTCDSNGSWIPNPADFIQSCSSFSTTVSPIATTGTNYFQQNNYIQRCTVYIYNTFNNYLYWSINGYS